MPIINNQHKRVSMFDCNPDIYWNTVWWNRRLADQCDDRFCCCRRCYLMIRSNHNYNMHADCDCLSAVATTRTHIHCNMWVHMLCVNPNGLCLQYIAFLCALFIYGCSIAVSVWHLAIPNRIDTWLPCASMMFSPQNACVMRTHVYTCKI